MAGPRIPQEDAVLATGAPGRFAALVAHFFNRYFEKEALSPGAEAETGITQLLAFLAIPAIFFVIICQPMLLRGWTLVGVRCFFISFSMIVMGLLAALKWDALFPDRQDYMTLTPLPLQVWTIFGAKCAALGIFAGLFLLDVNVFAVLLWPAVDSGAGNLAIMATHAAVALGSGLFVMLAVAALHGLLANVLGVRSFRRVSIVVQAALTTGFIMLLVLLPWIAGGVRMLIRSPQAAWYPPFWFLGLYEQLRPVVHDSALLTLGNTALPGLVAVAVLFVFTWLPGYRRHARRMLEASDSGGAGRRGLGRVLGTLVDRAILAHPVERGIFHHISQTITRSSRHRLFLAGYAGFGAALAVLSYGGDRSGLLRLPLTLSFVLVSGLRAAFNYPSELEANWAFQTAEISSPAPYMRAIRKWVAVCGVAPLFVLFAPVEFFLFPPAQALFHLAFGVALSLLLIEVLFLGFQKTPFTCARFPGKVNLAGLVAFYIFGFTAYSYVMAALESYLLAEPAAAVAFFACIAASIALVWRWQQRLIEEEPSLDYEDPVEPAVRKLGLTPD